MSIEGYLRAAPKAELHVHLEGSIRPSTLLALAQKNHVSLPADTIEGLQDWFVYSDFGHFVEVYFTITRCLRTIDDYELIAYEFGTEMARQNIRYAEVTFTPSIHKGLGIPFDVYFAGITNGRERARKELGVEMNWAFDIERSSDSGDYTVSTAIEGMKDGVVSLGLGGPEVGYPPESFARWFDKARAAGLHSVPHAGETVGPESVWGAIRTLGAERIGHGVRCIEDDELVSHIAGHKIVLEVCPTSNVCLGVFGSLADHPLRRLAEAGVIVAVNSDDPPLFNTTLNDEVVSLYESFKFDVPLIEEILLNGVRHSFLPDKRKQMLEAEFRVQMADLKITQLADKR